MDQIGHSALDAHNSWMYHLYALCSFCLFSVTLVVCAVAIYVFF